MEISQFLTLLPPILAIVLVLITRKPLLSLLISIISGLIILYRFSFDFIIEGILIFIKPLTDISNIKLILALFILGGFIGIVEAIISKRDIKLTKFFHKKRKVLFIGWISGLLFFIDDYFNILFNGVFLNSITKKHKISKAKLAFIIHSLGVSACVLIPFSTWTVYIISIIKNLKLNNGFSIYIHAIPYSFYPISLVLITLAVILYEINILKMKDEESKITINQEIEEEDKENKNTNKNSITIKELFFPPLTIVITSIILILSNLIYLKTTTVSTFSEIIANLSFTNILFFSGIIGTIIIAVYYVKKNYSIKSITRYFIHGGKEMSSAIGILILAWVMGELTIRLNTAQTFLDLSKNILTPSLLIFSSFLLTSVLSFMTSSWATFAITIPILLPLAIANGINPSIILAAIISGGIFGDHTSPMSSTTILTKAISKIEINKHFHTQLPYSMIAFVITGYLFYLLGVFY